MGKRRGSIYGDDKREQAEGARLEITETSKALFLAYARDAGNWSGQPLVGGNVGGSKEQRGNLTQLKRAGLITTVVDREDGRPLTWLTFTRAGIDFAVASGVDISWIADDAAWQSAHQGERAAAQ